MTSPSEFLKAFNEAMEPPPTVAADAVNMIQRLARQYAELHRNLGEILATLHLNLERGNIRALDAETTADFKGLVAKWWDHYHRLEL